MRCVVGWVSGGIFHDLPLPPGLGDNDEVLDSAEFLDLRTLRWTLTSSLKQGRTEHAMSLVYGIPTVIGGLSGREFLSSIEQFDKSSASWNVPLERDWRTVNSALSVPRYEMAVASVPVSQVKVSASYLLLVVVVAVVLLSLLLLSEVHVSGCQIIQRKYLL